MYKMGCLAPLVTCSSDIDGHPSPLWLTLPESFSAASHVEIERSYNPCTLACTGLS